MPIAVQCPACGQKYDVADSLAGKEMECRKCAWIIRVGIGRSDPAAPAQKPAPLELYHPEIMSWLPVEPKHVLCVGIGQGGRSLILGDMLSEGMIDQLMPEFSTVSKCRTETHDVRSAQEASNLIIQKGNERKLNTIVIPSVDVMPQMVAMMGMSRLQFAVGILTSVPEGTNPVVLVVSGTAEKGEKALANALRVNRKYVEEQEARRKAERIAQEQETRRVKDERRQAGKCTLCGEQLGFFRKLIHAENHAGCRSFKAR